MCKVLYSETYEDVYGRVPEQSSLKWKAVTLSAAKFSLPFLSFICLSFLAPTLLSFYPFIRSSPPPASSVSHNDVSCRFSIDNNYSWWTQSTCYSQWCEKRFLVIECTFKIHFHRFLSVQLSSVTRLGPIPRNPMDCSTPAFPVHHQLPELAQTHVHWVSDAIQPFHPVLSPFPPAFTLSQHQGLFQWVSSLHQVAKVLQFQLQHQSFQWIFRTDFLEDGLARSPCSPRDSQQSSPTPQFKSINSSALSFLYSPTLTIHDHWKNHSLD